MNRVYPAPFISPLSERDLILGEVGIERTAQDAQWGEQNHSSGTGPTTPPLWRSRLNAAMTARELAEQATSSCDSAADRGDLTWTDILLEETFEALAENEGDNLREELIQVAAVAVAWIECIDRRNIEREESA